MKILEWAILVASGALLAGGYALSQFSYFQGRAAQYAKSVDQPSIAMLSAVILLGAIVLYCLRKPEAES